MFRNAAIPMIYLLLGLSLSPELLAMSHGWFDTYFQYRIPATVDAESAGWNLVAINEGQITGAINRLEDLQFDPLWFAYNYLTAVEVDASGRLVDPNIEAGFYLIPQ